MFSLDPLNGVLSLTGDLHGHFGDYFLTVEARDLGIPRSLATNLTVQTIVKDRNDRPVIYKPKPGHVYSFKENLAPEKLEIPIKAMDSDAGSNAKLNYGFKKSYLIKDWKYFKIDDKTGLITSENSFDFETKNLYTLTVEVCDDGQPSICSQVEFVVQIEDANDNCPFFPETESDFDHLSISENQMIPDESGLTIGEIPSAVDNDTILENRAICYKIQEILPHSEAFSLANQSSTFLMSKKSFDREVQSSYQLTIETFDCHHQCANVLQSAKMKLILTVLISDLNDNSPRFVQSIFYGGGIQGITDIGDRVARITATDADDSSVLTYQMQGMVHSELENGYLNTERPAFFVDNITGDVTTNLLLETEWKGKFDFQIVVSDENGHYDSAIVVIDILGYDQQVELIFEMSANRIWDQASEIKKLLTQATGFNSTIDDVRANNKRVANVENKNVIVLVHFLSDNGSVLPIDNALKSLDMPKKARQKTAKKLLIRKYQLKLAGFSSKPNSGAFLLDSTITNLYLAMACAIGGLVLILIMLTTAWFNQSQRQKRKLKAATLAFSTSFATFDIPGTNIHSLSNPVWNGINVPEANCFRLENFPNRNSTCRRLSSNGTFSNNEIQFGCNSNRAITRCPQMTLKSTEL